MKLFRKRRRTGPAPDACRHKPLAGFRRSRKGSVAIEFAALVIPFSLLVFAILESSISFAAQQMMSNITDDIARQIRTGQLLETEIDEEGLKKRICDRLELVVSDGCPGLEVDLQSYDSFEEAADVRIKFNGGDIDTSDFAVTPGDAMTINMLRVFYRWPVMTDFMRASMSNLNGGKTLHFATVTWRNEPFDE